MSLPYTFLANLAATLPAVPADSILSRTVFQEAQLKVILFKFAPGQELSEHTAAVPAILQLLEGEATLTLGPDTYPVTAGAWAYMPPHLSHSLKAQTPVVMLLLMMQKGGA